MCEVAFTIEPYEKILLASGVWSATKKEVLEFSSIKKFQAPVEWKEKLIAEAVKEKMTPMVCDFLTSHDENVEGGLTKLSEVCRITADSLYQNLSPIVNKLSEEGISVMLLKGADLALTVYPQTLPRYMVDIDLLVKPTDVPVVTKVFSENGFMQGNLNTQKLCVDPIPENEKANHLAQQHELFPFNKIIKIPFLSKYAELIEKHLPTPYFIVLGDEVYFPLEYDIHINFGRDFELIDIWRAPRKIDLPTREEILGQSISNMLWFLALKLYHEVMMLDKPSIRLFADVLAVIQKYNKLIDWDFVMKIVSKYDLYAPLFYVLWYANEFLDTGVPSEVIHFCNPKRRNVKKFYDLGDFVPKMFGGGVVSSLKKLLTTGEL